MNLSAKQIEVILLLRNGEKIEAEMIWEDASHCYFTKRNIAGRHVNGKTIDALYKKKLINQNWGLTDLGKTMEL